MKTLEEIKEEADKIDKQRQEDIIKTSLRKFNDLGIGVITSDSVQLTCNEAPYIKWEGYTLFILQNNIYEVQRDCSVCNMAKGDDNSKAYHFGTDKLIAHIKKLEELPHYSCVWCSKRKKSKPPAELTFWERLFGKKQIDYPVVKGD